MKFASYFSSRLIFMSMLATSLSLTVMKASAKTTVEYSVEQSTHKVTGLVQDGNGEALIGVNVLIKGSTVGIVTDVDGKFALNAKKVTCLLFLM